MKNALVFRRCQRLLIALCALLAIQGCRLPAERRVPTPDLATALPSPTATPSAVLEPLPTTAPPTAEPLTLVAPPSQAPDPLRFTFPNAISDPVSHWRPPLYPIPWEPTPNDHFYFMRPIGANEVNWPLAKYRYGGVFFEDTVHSGVDIPAPKGTPVLAASSGTVIWAGYGLFFLREEFQDPYGLAVAIEHDFGYQGSPLYTVYGHMDELFTYRGQHVDTGQVIGLSGETGNVTGPHLHFEVRLDENKGYRSRNPELWISPPQGWGVLAGRVLNDSGGLLAKKTVHLRNLATQQHWEVISYGKGGVNSDPYYRENMVIGDLPAGNYMVWIDHNNNTYKTTLEIQPGMVAYFTFTGRFGFEVGLPPTPAPDYNLPETLITPSP